MEYFTSGGQRHNSMVQSKRTYWKELANERTMGERPCVLCAGYGQCKINGAGCRIRILIERIPENTCIRLPQRVEMEIRCIYGRRAFEGWIDKGRSVWFTDGKHTWGMHPCTVQYCTRRQASIRRSVACIHRWLRLLGNPKSASPFRNTKRARSPPPPL